MDTNREKVIVRTSIIGIVANVALAAVKALIGLITNSIAITLDAVNNLSDAISSIITIIGTKLSGKAADKDHPFGYGRIEYLTQSVIAVIILYAGITGLVESVKKLITPEDPDYSLVSFIVLAIAIAVKVILGLYVSRTGKKVNSGSLVASGKDAMSDAIVSASVVASGIIFITTHINIEAIVGIIISALIVKTGVELIKEAVDEIIGKRVTGTFTKAIKATVCKEEGVMGAYDLILNNYGPDNYLGSVHIEIDEELTASEIDAMTRRIQDSVYKEHGVVLTTVGIYAVNKNDEHAVKRREEIRALVMAHEEVLAMHGFYFSEVEKKVSFDALISFEAKDREAVHQAIIKEVTEMLPDFRVIVNMDAEITD